MHRDNHTQASKPVRKTLKIQEAAQCLGVSAATVRRLIDRGELQAVRKLRHTLVTMRSIDDFVGE